MALCEFLHIYIYIWRPQIRLFFHVEITLGNMTNISSETILIHHLYVSKKNFPMSPRIMSTRRNIWYPVLCKGNNDVFVRKSSENTLLWSEFLAICVIYVDFLQGFPNECENSLSPSDLPFSVRVLQQTPICITTIMPIIKRDLFGATYRLIKIRKL